MPFQEKVPVPGGAGAVCVSACVQPTYVCVCKACASRTPKGPPTQGSSTECGPRLFWLGRSKCWVSQLCPAHPLEDTHPCTNSDGISRLPFLPFESIHPRTTLGSVEGDTAGCWPRPPASHRHVSLHQGGPSPPLASHHPQLPSPFPPGPPAGVSCPGAGPAHLAYVPQTAVFRQGPLQGGQWEGWQSPLPGAHGPCGCEALSACPPHIAREPRSLPVVQGSQSLPCARAAHTDPAERSHVSGEQTDPAVVSHQHSS